MNGHRKVVWNRDCRHRRFTGWELTVLLTDTGKRLAQARSCKRCGWVEVVVALDLGGGDESDYPKDVRPP